MQTACGSHTELAPPRGEVSRPIFGKEASGETLALTYSIVFRLTLAAGHCK